MKRILIQLDDRTAAQLELVAPRKGRKRSDFLRRVIARALRDAVEEQTQAAYEKWPDAAPLVDSGDWANEADAVHPR